MFSVPAKGVTLMIYSISSFLTEKNGKQGERKIDLAKMEDEMIKLYQIRQSVIGAQFNVSKIISENYL